MFFDRLLEIETCNDYSSIISIFCIFHDLLKLIQKFGICFYIRIIGEKWKTCMHMWREIIIRCWNDYWITIYIIFFWFNLFVYFFITLFLKFLCRYFFVFTIYSFPLLVLYLLEIGKLYLANDFIYNLNNFLQMRKTQRPPP